MSLKIRMSRAGAKKRPYFRIVVADSRFPRDGRFIERVGSYDPLLPKDHAGRVKLAEDRIKHWLSVGARPSDRVHRFLDAAGILKREPRNNPIKAKPGQKRLDREEAKREAEAKKKEEAAAAKQAEKAAAEAPKAEQAPAEEAATEAPAEKAPAEESKAEEIPAQDAPAEQAKAEAEPAGEAAAEEAKAGAPTEETRADEAPAEEVPAEEKEKKE